MTIDKRFLLSPSKAALLEGYPDDFAFLKQYLLQEKREQSESMQQGVRVHNLFYNAILRQIDSASISSPLHEPESWPTKAECGTTIAEQKRKFYESEKPPERVFLRPSDVAIYQSLERWIELSGFFKTFPARDLEIEADVSNETAGLTGIFDLVDRRQGRIIDIKTTSRVLSDDVARYNWKSLAIQQLVYQQLYAGLAGRAPLKSFQFLFIQTAWPYQIAIKTIPEEALRLMRQKLEGKIKPYFRRLCDKLKSLQRAAERKKWLNESVRRKGLLKMASIYNLIEFGLRGEPLAIPEWDKKKLQEELQ